MGWDEGLDGGRGVPLPSPCLWSLLLSCLSPERVTTVTKGSSHVHMDGGVAPTSPRRASTTSVSPLHPQRSSWLVYLQTEESVFSVSNNNPEMWSTITQKCGLNHIFVCSWSKLMKNRSLWTLPAAPRPHAPGHGNCHHTLVFFYNEVLVSDIFMETAVVGLGLLG